MEQQVTPPSTQFLPPCQDELPDSLVVESMIDRTALGDRVPFILKSRKMAAFVATSSPEEQEALEVRMARQQEALRLQEMRKARQIAKSSSATTIIRPVGLTLLDLPPEILIHTLFHLPFASIVICQRVNRHLYILISQSTELQYYIHLGASGLVDNPSCDLSVPERLSQLLERERRWGRLDFDFDKIVKVPFECQSSTFTLTAGIFGGHFTDDCRYMQIPGTATEEIKWRTIRTEQAIIIDAPGFHKPDLHVLITAQSRTVYTSAAKPHTVHDIRIHLHQLSTGEPHPDVRRATISFETREEFEEPRAFITCAGDNMVLVLRDRGGSNRTNDWVLVYDWRIGELKLNFGAPSRSYCYPLFLTTHLFLLPNAATGNLEYWKIPQSTAEPAPSQPLFLLSLPRLHSGNIFQPIGCLAEPNPRSYNALKPFHVDPQHAIVIFYVNILSEGWNTSFQLFVHRTSLISYLDQLPALASFDGQPKPIPYEEWGPPICRWFDNDQGECLETTFGQRYITPPGAKEAHLTVLDFNPIDVAKVLAAENHLKAAQLNKDSDCLAQIEESYRAESVLQMDNTENRSECKGKGNQVSSQSHEASGSVSSLLTGIMEAYDSPGESRPRPRAVTRTMEPLNDPYGCFEHTVYSSLPYTIRSSKNKHRFDDLMLDEESILGIREDDEGTIKEIHIFHCA